MKSVIINLKATLKLFRDDKKLLLLSMVPVVIGLLCFFGLGTWLYTSVLSFGAEWIESMVGDGNWGVFLRYIIIGLLTAIMFFVVNWGFVIFVSVVAAPFNEVLSARTENLVRGKEPLPVISSIKTAFTGIVKTLINESKKVTVIVLMTIFAFVISIFPVLAPISVVIYATLLAAQFLDYSWCRHSLKFGKCVKDFKGSFVSYLLAGGMFLFLMSVPIVNLFALPFAVVFFTLSFTENRKKDSLLEG